MHSFNFFYFFRGQDRLLQIRQTRAEQNVHNRLGTSLLRPQPPNARRRPERVGRSCGRGGWVLWISKLQTNLNLKFWLWKCINTKFWMKKSIQNLKFEFENFQRPATSTKPGFLHFSRKNWGMMLTRRTCVMHSEVWIRTSGARLTLRIWGEWRSGADLFIWKGTTAVWPMQLADVWQ